MANDRVTNTPRRKPFLSLDHDYLVLLLLLIVNHLPIFQRQVVPVDDGMYIFHIFHYNYSEFLFCGDIARWLPYGMYGVPSAFDQLICLSPMCYLVGFLGALAGSRNVVLLFKIAILGEKLLFVTGLYLLTRTVYTNRLVRLLTCAVAILAMFWFTQFWFDWRIYYLLPFTLYFLIQFFRQQHAVFLWAAGLTAIASSLGSLIYFAPLLLFILTVFCSVMAFDGWRAFRALVRPSWSNLVGLAALAFCATAYCWQASHCLDDVALMAGGRDAKTAVVPLETFLTYGPPADSQILTSFLTGWPPYGGTTLYIGLLPLFCALWGVFNSRSTIFWAFLTAALALILLSLGGMTARLIYYFPAMSLYRHIGLVYGPVRLLLLLCSGFGLERLITCVTTRAELASRGLLRYLPAVVLAAAIPLDLWSAKALGDFTAHWGENALTPNDLNFLMVCGRFVLYLVLAVGVLVLVQLGCLQRTFWQSWAAVGLSLVLLADVGSFRYLNHITVPRVPEDAAHSLKLYRARPLSFCDRRCDSPTDPIACEALRQYKAFRSPAGHDTYTMAYNFLQCDPSFPRFRTDQMSQKAQQLLLARGGKPKQWPDEAFLPTNDPWLLNALGCSGSKVQITSQVLQVAGPAVQGFDAVRKIPPSSQCLLLRVHSGSGSEDLQAEPPCDLAENTLQDPTDAADQPMELVSPPPCAGTVEVLHFSANALSLKARVFAQDPCWLSYADSWHKDWRCTVNGTPATIIEANGAFKAVQLAPGESVVRFRFEGGVRYPLSLLVAGIGVLLALAGLAHSLWTVRGTMQQAAS
jgi:hypothetical protein